MRIDSIHSNKDEGLNISSSSGVTPDGAPRNLVGLLESNPDLRKAIKSLDHQQTGEARQLIGQLGHSITAAHYDEATSLLNQLREKYGVNSPLYSSVVDVLEETLPPAVLDSIGLGAPSAPANLTASPVGDSVQLQWTASPNATSYTIQRSTDNFSFTNVSTTSSTSYMDSSVQPQTTYYYRVIAVSSEGSSTPSSVVSITTSEPTPPPPPPPPPPTS